MNYLFGASGHGKVIFDILQRRGVHIDAFVDAAIKPSTFMGIPCLQETAVAFQSNDYLLFSIGSNAIRKTLSEKYFTKSLTVVHSNAVIGSGVSIDIGTAVMAHAVINADATIGKHAIINTGAVIEHDCVVEDFAHISPHATLCGNVKVGAGSHIGAGAVVIPGITIGKGCIIGAGAVIIKDIPDSSIVVGNPGHIIRTIQNPF